MDQSTAKDLITTTFMSMAETTPLEDIRVVDLIARSGVSRATFYRLFRDKYDVMNWAFQTSVDTIVTEHPDLTNMRAWTSAAFDHIKAHKRFFHKILSYRGQNSFFDFMAEYFTSNIRNSVEASVGEEGITEEIAFAIEAFGHVSAFAQAKWIREDCKTDTDRFLALMRPCVPDCLRPYYSDE